MFYESEVCEGTNIDDLPICPNILRLVDIYFPGCMYQVEIVYNRAEYLLFFRVVQSRKNQ